MGIKFVPDSRSQRWLIQAIAILYAVYYLNISYLLPIIVLSYIRMILSVKIGKFFGLYFLAVFSYLFIVFIFSVFNDNSHAILLAAQAKFFFLFMFVIIGYAYAKNHSMSLSDIVSSYKYLLSISLIVVIVGLFLNSNTEMFGNRGDVGIFLVLLFSWVVFSFLMKSTSIGELFYFLFFLLLALGSLGGRTSFLVLFLAMVSLFFFD